LQNYSLNIFVNPANISSKKSKMSFGYGLSPEISKEIKHCNIDRITKELAKRGIETDFTNNKVVAWCSNQAVKIFEHLNEKYGLNLSLPKGIFVEDFVKLKISEDYGKCNWYPAYLPPESDRVFPERTIIFNSFESKLKTVPESAKWKYQWENIDNFTEELYKNGISSSAHFLWGFLHEITHVANNAHVFELFKELSPQEILLKLRSLTSEEYSNEFKIKHGGLLSVVSKRAMDGPFEAFAEDKSVKIANSLDSITLLPKYNPFKSDPCFSPSVLARLKGLKRKEKVIKKAYEGQKLL